MNKKIATNKAFTALSGLIKTDPHFAFAHALITNHPTAEVYLVGGVVRDTILGRKTKDYDFVVRNVPIAKLQAHLKKFGSVNLVGKKFGVLKFVANTGSKKSSLENLEPFDIALPRQEFSENHTGHYRDFSIQSDHRLALDQDLSRRDFTMNAIAYNIQTRELVDPYNGLADIQKKQIRAVGNASRRFAEDYSRMLRAIRFACQLGFTIEPQTRKAIEQEIKHINKKIKPTKKITKKIDANNLRAVPFEVIAKEMARTFAAHPVMAFDLYDKLGAFAQLMPEFLATKDCEQPKEWHSEGTVWVHSRLALHYLLSSEFKKEFGNARVGALLAITVLLHDIGKPYTKKTPEADGVDRVRFDGHDRVGAIMARDMTQRLRLASANVDASTVWWLIHHHLLLLNSDVPKMKSTTIEKYFFKDAERGLLLRQLIFVDSLASKRKDGKTSLSKYRQLTKRLKELPRKGSTMHLPQPLITGGDIMKALSLKPGPQIGALILSLREEQLAGAITTKKEALSFIKKIGKH